jgi:hypothetical protein
LPRLQPQGVWRSSLRYVDVCGEDVAWLMYIAVYAFVRYDDELHPVGVCAGNTAPACPCKGHCGRHLSQLDLEFLRRHDHTDVTQLAGLEGVFNIHVFELLVHSVGGKLLTYAV